MQRRKSNHKQQGVLIATLAVILLTAGVWNFVQSLKADPPPIQENVTVTATVLGCGDGVIQLGEDCDGANMNGHTCTTEGFLSGSISCQANCTLNTTSCSDNPASSGGGTPVSGTPPTVSSTNEIFSGYAYPGSPVTILKDGAIMRTVTADAIGAFYARVDNLLNGTYTFGFRTTDVDGNSSALTTRTVNATGGTVTHADIFLSPTLAPITETVFPGNALMLSGQSTPTAMVTITITSPTNAVVSRQTVTVGNDGNYSTSVNTSSFTTEGTYTATAVASLDTLQSTDSLPLSIPVGVPPMTYMPGDYNENLRVNLVDFSIALYWYKETLSDAFKILEIRHGNGDGLLNLIDISILAYWWTG